MKYYIKHKSINHNHYIFSAMDIANYFIYYNNLQNNKYGPLSLSKLLKLLYYAEGCSLALYNSNLFSDNILAWEYGPAIENVFNYFSHSLTTSFNKKSAYKNSSHKYSIYNFSTIYIINHNYNIKKLLINIFHTFGSYSTQDLETKSRSEYPWLISTNYGKSLNNIISKKIIKTYFKNNYIKN